MRFFTGLDCPFHAQHFDAAFISVNRLRQRKGPFAVGDWIMDSGAFTEVVRHGGYRFDVEEYAAHIRKWAGVGRLLAAVSQDYMCEAFVLEKAGKTVAEHQQLTVDRYDALMACDTADVYIMPVLQGYAVEEYVRHIRMYGERLRPGAWVGVGSVCKRNADIRQIEDVLLTIHMERPNLRLHGFGLKTTALSSGLGAGAAPLRRLHGVEPGGAEGRARPARLERGEAMDGAHYGETCPGASGVPPGVKNKPVPAKGRPPKQRAWLTVMDDGREVLDLRTRRGQAEYKARTLAMWARQEGKCALCPRRMAMAEATFDHEVPRGSGGSMRDDRIEIRVEHADGRVTVLRQNQAAHWVCNVLKGSRRDVRGDMLLRQMEFAPNGLR